MQNRSVSMFRLNEQHTGVAATGGLGIRPMLNWTYDAGSWVAKISEHDGAVFASGQGQVHCIDAQTGVGRWTFETGRTIYSCPAIVDGSVFFGSADNCVYCVDAETGSLSWKYETGAFVCASPTVVEDLV